MLFNSLPFLYLFLPVTYAVFWRLSSRPTRYVWLTVTGYVFYSFWNYKFCAIMGLSTLVSYISGLGFLRWTHPKLRTMCLVIPVTIDLSLLGFFKYANFALSTLQSIATVVHTSLTIRPIDVVLPIGISFYTFHTITYIVDSYRGVIKPTRNFFEFACYVSFFAQLVAGPIVRFREIEGDLDRIDGRDRRSHLDRGWSFFALGIFKKVLIADTLAKTIDPLIGSAEGSATVTAWLCALGYTYQLYFDFSGYSDMAVGLGELFGLRLPQNFNSPYKAVSIADFWRRWHISLSSVLRDYLYIPLGGNRRGPLFTLRNIWVTFLLGGLWHGAKWTFVIWGGYHGALLCLHRAFSHPWARLPAALQRSLTFLLVVFGWVFFRAETFDKAIAWLRSLFVWHGGRPSISPVFACAFVAAAVVAHACPNTFEIKHKWNAVTSLGFAVAFAVTVLLMSAGHESPFLYFQF
jgi:alginate O-acetyltransferase complex protein AlgI